MKRRGKTTVPTLRLINDEGEPGKSFSLSKNPFTVGSDRSNTLPLDDGEVARHHCQITSDAENVFITDTGSSSGTFVNEQPIEHLRLSGGDRIRVGKTEFVLDDSRDNAPDEESAVLDKQERMLMVGETACLVSHRINNILQGINGGSHLVELGIKKGDLSITAKGWESVGKKQAELSELIFALLRLGKPFEPNKSPLDLVVITRQTLDRMSEHFQSAGVTVRIEPQPDSLKTNADFEGLTSAMENLLYVASQACHYESSPLLDVGFEETDQEVSLRIDYRGAAICLDPAELSIPASPEERVVGEIEFAISRKIIREHHGDVLLTKFADRTHRILLTLPKH